MRPAFSSTKQAAAFALLLLLALLSPVLAGKKVLPPREQAYGSLSWTAGAYPYVQQQIFEEKGAIDILFIGSSHIGDCIDTRRLQAELGQQLGRPATIRVFAWGGAGYDALYFTAKDVLENRPVKMLVFYDDHAGTFRNPRSPAWFRFADGAKALAGLPLPEQAYFYFAAIVGMPRNLLSLMRPNLPMDLEGPSYITEHYRTPNLAANLGSISAERGFDSDPYGEVDTNALYRSFSPANGTTSADVSIYSPETKTNFEFSTAPLPAWEKHFMSLFADLAARHDCQLVMLDIPVFAERRTPWLEERAYWPDIFGANLTLLGIPPAKMFAGLSDDEVQQLFLNQTHLNKNGQIFFTSLLLPSLLQIYETKHNN